MRLNLTKVTDKEFWDLQSESSEKCELWFSTSNHLGDKRRRDISLLEETSIHLFFSNLGNWLHSSFSIDAIVYF